MKRFVSILIMGSSLALLGLFIWGANKGFDLSDEGLYILNLLYPEETAPYWKYGFIYKQLLGWMGLEVIGYRIIKIVLIVAACVFFAAELSKWLGTKTEIRFNRMTLSALLFCGASSVYAIGPPTLSYNDLALIYGMFVMALFVRYQRKSKAAIELKWPLGISLAFAGLVLAFLMFAKFTTSFILLAILIGGLFALALLANRKVSEFGLELTFLFSGFIAGLIYHLVNIGNPGDYVSSFKDSLDTVPGHDSVTLFKTYSRSLRTAFVEGVINYIEVPFALVALYLLKKRGVFSEVQSSNALLVLPFYLAVRFYIDDFHLSGSSHGLTAFNAYLTLLVVMLLVFSFTKTKKSALFKTEFVVLILLFLMPFVCALGTNNALPLQASLYQVFWLIGMFILLAKMPSRHKSFALLMIVLLAAIPVSQAVHGYYFKPYRIPGTLADQNLETVEMRKSTALRIHPSFGRFIFEMDSVLEENCQLESPHPIISLFYDPGICYLLDGIGPGSPWYKFSNDRLNCFNVELSKLDNLNESIIISENGGMVREAFINCLKEQGFDFPAGYRLIGKSIHPIYGTDVFVMAPRPLLINIPQD